MLSFSLLKQEKTIKVFAKSMKNHKKRFKSVMNKLIDKQTSIMLRHNK